MNDKIEKASSYHHGNLRESLLSHLLELIREKGFESFSLRQLATRVGVSQAAIYRHFADKDALLAELASQALLELMAIVNEAILGADTLAEKVRSACTAYLDYAVAQPEKYRLMFGSIIKNKDNYSVLIEAGELAMALLLSFVEEGQASGEFAEGNTALIASSSWSSLHGYALFLIDDLYSRLVEPEDKGAMIEQHIGMMLKSLQA